MTRGHASVDWRPDSRELHLHNGSLSYVIRILGDGSLGHVHVGSPLAADRSHASLPPAAFEGFANRLGDPIPFEYPTTGGGDFRVPALGVVHADGSQILALRYLDHRIEAGKPALDDLPATYVEAEDEATTLIVTLGDEPSGLEVDLFYTIFAALPVVARSVRLRNEGRDAVRVDTAMSISLDLADADWDLVHLAGTWARERHVTAESLTPGRHAVDSRRGASSHEHNPFLLLRRPNATEDAGEAFACSLVYSGNFLAEVEVDAFRTTRMRLGINPDTFSWRLGAGERLQLPEALLVHSATGIATLSDALHRLLGTRLARGAWRDRPRPILVNNWEATYFDFDESKLMAIATAARDLGIELFVLDDGWFGRRDDDTTSLGDWLPDRRKLPNGLDGLARRIESLGLGFGIWIEPEMVSRRSELFEAHPDWALGVPGRPRTEGRNQYVLDLGRAEVVDHLTAVLSGLLSSAPISYVKWDMNRALTEPFSVALPADRQGEVFHRHILGVYELYRRLTEAFPDVLFESCAGGGGRFDAGLLAFAPQAWTSDDTDAIERLRIQWGTSLAYPVSSIGAHVSAIPNHQVGRVTPLSTRAAVAFFGVFGYELDVTRFDEAEREAVADQVAFYKQHRELLQFGRFRRLVGPWDGDGDVVAWMTTTQDGRRAIVGVYVVLNRPMPGPRRVRLANLDPALTYRVDEWPRGDSAAALASSRGGDDLMAVGLDVGGTRHDVAARGDFWARLFVLAAE